MTRSSGGSSEATATRLPSDHPKWPPPPHSSRRRTSQRPRRPSTPSSRGPASTRAWSGSGRRQTARRVTAKGSDPLPPPPHRLTNSPSLSRAVISNKSTLSRLTPPPSRPVSTGPPSPSKNNEPFPARHTESSRKYFYICFFRTQYLALPYIICYTVATHIHTHPINFNMTNYRTLVILLMMNLFCMFNNPLVIISCVLKGFQKPLLTGPLPLPSH